jgi:hypothetical protein
MKKLIITAAMWMGVSAANLNASTFCGAGMLANYGEIIVSHLSGLKLKVLIKNDERKNAQVLIKNIKGDVYFEQYLSKSQELNKIFDVSLLPDGNYQIIVTVGQEKQTKSFEIKSNTNRAIVEVN